MHVALVGDFPEELARPRGGVEAVTGCLARGLIERGVEVSVVHYGAATAGVFRHPDLGCEVHGVPRVRPAGLTFRMLAPRQVDRLLEQLRPDVVHVHGLPELRRSTAFPSVVTVHGIPHRDARHRPGLSGLLGPSLRRASFERSLRSYTRAIAISPYVAEEVRGNAPATRAIPNPVEDAFFDVERKPISNRLLCVGVVDRRKNAVALVAAGARIRDEHPDVRHRMAGAIDPDYEPALRSALARYAMEDRFDFLGALDRTALLDELRQCTGVVLPSLQETAPMVLQEAMAAGVPVIASAVGGVPAMLRDGALGTLFDPRDEARFAAQLRAFLSDAEVREARARDARRVIQETCRLDTVVDATLEVYREAIRAFREAA